jgi:hypothetical protein
MSAFTHNAYFFRMHGKAFIGQYFLYTPNQLLCVGIGTIK